MYSQLCVTYSAYLYDVDLIFQIRFASKYINKHKNFRRYDVFYPQNSHHVSIGIPAIVSVILVHKNT